MVERAAFLPGTSSAFRVLSRRDEPNRRTRGSFVAPSIAVASVVRARRRATVRASVQQASTELASAASSALVSAGSSFTGISILAGIVVVHELGHFIAARAQGIRVANFSIGFGPTLWSYTPKGSETEFTLRAIPFGGFVAFPDPAAPAEESEKSDDAEQKVGETVEKPPAIDSDDPDLLQNRPVFDRMLVISAGVIANILFAWGALFASATLVGQPTLSFLPGSVITAIPSPSSSAGAQAGLQLGDLLRSINGVEIPAAPGSAAEAARTIRSSSGRPLQLEVERAGQLFPIEVLPKCCTPEGDALLGVTLSTNSSVSRTKPSNPLQAVEMTNREFKRIAAQTLGGQLQLIRNFGAQMEDVAGPIGVVSMGADIARRDSNGLFLFMAAISINLAFINALPLPALDGGQMVFLIIEAAKGSPIPSKYQNAINQSFLAILAFFSIELLFKDVSRLLPFLNR